MKNYKYIIFFLIVLSKNAISQTKSNYEKGFENGFSEGYCYNKSKYSCYPPMNPFTPYPRLNERTENYTQGYNRGFQYGLDLRRSNDALRNSDISLNQKIISFNNYDFNKIIFYGLDNKFYWVYIIKK